MANPHYPINWRVQGFVAADSLQTGGPERIRLRVGDGRGLHFRTGRDGGRAGQRQRGDECPVGVN